MFFHFVRDDKFISDSIKCFEEAGLTNNRYYYIDTSGKRAMDFPDDKIMIISPEQLPPLLSEPNNCDAIVLHSLYSMPAWAISRIPSNIKVIWFAWGFDLYSNWKPIKPLLTVQNRFLPETAKLINIAYHENRLKTWFKHSLKLLIDRYYSPSFLKKAINRVDYFAGVFQEEFDMMRESLPYFRADKIIHNYIHPIEFKKEEILTDIQQHGTNIMLGNSATSNINHLDLLSLLYERIGVEEMKIYCPLSYAGNDIYINAIINKGRNLFGDRFIPMTTYLPIEKYTEILVSCGNVVLGQMQQAATCNILTSIWGGLKVYTPKDSMNYHHYRDIEKVNIFSIEDDLTIDKIRTPLDNESVINSRRRIEGIYSYRQWKEDLQESVRTIFGR